VNNEQIELLMKRIMLQYELSAHGIHGPSHWKRVQTLGWWLADAEGADHTVVRLFSMMHDACRRNEGEDMMHGPRAANLVITLCNQNTITVRPKQRDLLIAACESHTFARPGDGTEDITIQCCIDADRLDLCRLGIVVDPDLLFTTTGKLSTMREGAIRLFNESRAVR